MAWLATCLETYFGTFLGSHKRMRYNVSHFEMSNRTR